MEAVRGTEAPTSGRASVPHSELARAELNSESRAQVSRRACAHTGSQDSSRQRQLSEEKRWPEGHCQELWEAIPVPLGERCWLSVHMGTARAHLSPPMTVTKWQEATSW